jgi:pimeloyl-ACP methyl ester carboxylesterase
MDAEQKLLAKLKSPARLEQTQIDGLSINYLTAGQGKPLLLLHGANMGWGQWYENIDALAKYFTVYAIDLPGAGKSTKIAYKHLHPQRHFVEVVEKFIEQKKLQNISIIAHSVGAWVALKLSLREKAHISKMVLISPIGFSIRNPIQYMLVGIKLIARLLSKTLMKIRPFSMKKFVESGFYNKTKLDNEFFNYYYESIQHSPENHPLLLMNKMTNVLKVKKEFILLDFLKNIKIPVLIIGGLHDKIVPPHHTHLEAFKLIPNGQIEIMTDSGHVPFLEEKEKFNNIIIGFLTTS